MALAAYAAENSIVQLTATQLEPAKRIVVVLSPVEEITQLISKETAALSVVILNMRVLLRSWEKQDDDQGIHAMKRDDQIIEVKICWDRREQIIVNSYNT